MLEGEAHRSRRSQVVLLALLSSLVVGALGIGAGSASNTSPTGSFGPLRIDMTNDLDSIDPARAYFAVSWQLERATCATLVNYPDAVPPEGTRLVPEIAAAMPSISGDGRTYTFQIRSDYAFSPPASGVVTAQSMKYTFERTGYGPMQSPGYQFMTNIVGAQAYHDGQANEITGIVAQGSTLTITLIEPQGHFLTLLAMPFFCAIPTSLPRTPVEAPIPSAGPYYISQHTLSSRIVAPRNPNYTGPRPHRFDSIEYTLDRTPDQIRQRIESGVSDYSPSLTGVQHDELAPLYGPDSPAAGRGLQQWFSNAGPCVYYLPLNTERPLFADPNMRKAVNYAIDRAGMIALYGATNRRTTDQIVPPGFPGFVEERIYPDHPDIARARELADWQPGDPLRPAVLYHSTGGIGPQLAQNIRQQLLEIGIDLTLVGWQGFQIYEHMGHRGEPFDLGTVGWCQDWFDPWDFIQLLDGTTIQAENNNNLAYFDDPVFNDRMHAANQLVGEPRYAAFGQIEHDLEVEAAPWAAWANPNDNEFFSQRIGCHVHEHLDWVDLLALCLRPEITTDDATILEPAIGIETVNVTVRLSSEMESQVTVDYATQDGTAEEGEDYGGASGQLTFTPHERTRTVSVEVYDDVEREPSETFFLNLSNESSGTMIDGQAVVTILDRPIGPPPPNPPPPPAPQPPPPQPQPPPPQVRCVVPRVIGLTLARARSRIRSKHCSVGRVRRARSKRARVGRVISQSPRAGVRRARGARVSLVVGRR